MTTSNPVPPARRLGFTLVEVILAVGVVGIAFASLVGILTSSFQQVDDIMQTNKALTSAQGLVTALDNPRSILYNLSVTSGLSSNATAGSYLPSSGIDNTAGDASNFDLVYNLINNSTDTVPNSNPPVKCVWLYVYERKQVVTAGESSTVSGSGAMLYNLNGNPALVEVLRMSNDTMTPDLAQARNVIGSPMRVRLTLSRLLVGQRVTLNTSTGEPDSTTYSSGALPPAPAGGFGADGYALAYLPIVAEFYPHEYEAPATFKASTNDQQPVLVQTIIINR